MKDRMTKIKEIIENHQSKKIEGVLIDVQTANAILTVSGNLSDENKAKFHAMDIGKMGAVAWKAIGKASK